MPKAPFKISVVIPVFNGENYLAQAIKSVLDQKDPFVEILVIDDGSQDNTASIAQSFGDQIRYIRKENGGVSTALNLGLQEATGHYFAWLSHDDFFLPGRFAALRSYMGEGDVIISHNSEYTDENRKHLRSSFIPHRYFPVLPYGLLWGWCFHGCSVLIPISSLKAVGAFNASLRFSQDIKLWMDLSLSNKHIHLDESYTAIRLHGNQGVKSPIVFQAMLKELDDLYTQRILSLHKDNQWGSLLSLHQPGKKHSPIDTFWLLRRLSIHYRLILKYPEASHACQEIMYDLLLPWQRNLLQKVDSIIFKLPKYLSLTFLFYYLKRVLDPKAISRFKVQ